MSIIYSAFFELYCRLLIQNEHITMCVCVYIYVHVYIYICVYIYLYRYRQRQSPFSSSLHPVKDLSSWRGLWLPVDGPSLSSLDVEVAAKPLQPTSTGCTFAFQPCCCTLVGKFSIPMHLPLVGLLYCALPGHCELYDVDNLEWSWPQNKVWSQVGGWHLRWEAEFLA